MNGKVQKHLTGRFLSLLALAFVFALGSASIWAHCGTCGTGTQGQGCRMGTCAKEGATCVCKTADATGEGVTCACKTADVLGKSRTCVCKNADATDEGVTCTCKTEDTVCVCKTAVAKEETQLSPLVAAAKAKVEAAGVGFLTAQDLSAKLKSKTPPVLIDVLSANSYAQSHIQGAINIPSNEIAKTAPTTLKDKNAEIVVYCGSYQCGASLNAAKALKELGYTNIQDYKGGLKEWTELGLPLVKPTVKE